MEFFYLVALFPIIVGTVLFIKQKEINWYEYIGSCIICLALAAIFHVCAIVGMTDDIETFSGQLSRAVHYPRWIEEYTTTETTTDSDGHTHTHTETHHRTHQEHWTAETTFGSYLPSGPDHEISQDFFNEIVKKFANLTTETPWKSGFDSGDKNIYVAYNKTGYVYPVTTTKHFENKLKASPSVFSFAKIPKDMKGLYSWPRNDNWLQSERLLGSAALSIDLRLFDLMNSRIGPSKKINVIMIGFGSADASIAQWQKAKWVGGKKNDIVICFGGSNKNPSWANVFGWSESELCKKNLESIILSNPINNDILPLIEKEIKQNYVIKEWNKFDYIRIKPPTWSYIVFIIVLFVSMIGCWIYFYNNSYDKDGYYRGGYQGYQRKNWPFRINRW